MQDRQERPHRNDRRFNAQGERNDRNQPGRGRFRDQPRFEPTPENREQPDVDFGAMSALPAFITAPVRPLAPPPAVEPRAVAEAEARADEQPRPQAAPAPAPAPAEPSPPPAVAEGAPQEEDGEGHFHLRPRRRRRVARAEEPAEGGPTETPEPSSAE